MLDNCPDTISFYMLLASTERDSANSSSPKQYRSASPVLETPSTSEQDIDLSVVEDSVPLIDTASCGSDKRKKGGNLRRGG